MKRIIVPIALLLVFFTSCGKIETEDNLRNVSVHDVVNNIAEKYGLTDGFVFTSSSTELGEYLDDDLILAYYGDALDVPDFSKIAEYCVYIDESDANVIIDVGLFKMADVSYADTFMDYLQVRIDDKIEDSEEYSSIDVPTLEAAVIDKYGDYVYYVVSYDVDDIVADIKAALVDK